MGLCLLLSTAEGQLSPLTLLTPPGAVRDGRVEAQLISQQQALIRGQDNMVGLRLKMDEHWHTYWQNPGDSGLATTLRWNLPEGITAGAIQWPAPDYFEVSGLASYAYEGEIVLPMKITVDQSFDQGSVTLEARADWLVCREACEPGRAQLQWTLPVVDAPADTSPEQRWNALFAWAMERQPRHSAEPVDAAAATVAWDGDRYLLQMPAGLDRMNNGNDLELHFFPAAPLVIAQSAEQEMLLANQQPRGIYLLPDPQAPAPAERLEGVLTIRHGNDFRAYHIDQPVRRVAEAGVSQ